MLNGLKVNFQTCFRLTRHIFTCMLCVSVETLGMKPKYLLLRSREQNSKPLKEL